MSSLPQRLASLEAQWRRLGAPTADALRPGLSEDELDAIGARLGMPVPNELRVLWAWHDGTDPDAGWARTIGPGGYTFLTASESVDEYEWNIDVHNEDEDAAQFGLYWRRAWVPFMTQDAQRLFIDTSRAADGVSPVGLVTKEWEYFLADRAKGLWHAVSVWTWLLENDFYRWDDTLKYPNWTTRWDDIPLFLRQGDLA